GRDLSRCRAGDARRRQGRAALMRTVRLLAASLHYGAGLMLHTASSGPVTALEELYLVVDQDGALAGFGEIRANCGYLTGLTAGEVRADAIALTRALDW